MLEYDGLQKKTSGELLKETRESKRISLETVHESTKIPMDVLKAIEEGYSVRTMSSFYLKGFIKMYAEYLGVDSVKILEQPSRILQKAGEPSKPKITQLKEKTYKLYENDFEFGKVVSKDRQRQIVKIVGVLILLFLFVKMIGCFIPKKDEKKVETLKNIPIISPQKIAENKLVYAKPVKSKETSNHLEKSRVEGKKNVPVKEAVKTDKVNLTIKALKGGWLQVKVDGIVVMESTVRAGAVESWTADREIIISGRTIHNLEFKLNGKVLGTLGRQDRNARRVVITKKGLAVKG